MLLLTAVAAAVWMGGGSESPGKTKEKSGAPVSHERPRPQTHEGAAKKEPGTEKVPEDAAVVAKRAEEKKATLEAINDAATTYEAAQLPFINKYLYDRDPEVRKAAMEAMLVLGDAGAGKYLREAAQSAATEAERDALVKAADYSELPPVDMKTMAEQRKLQKQNNPSGNERRPRRDRGVGQKRLENGAPPATGQPTGDAPVPNPAPTPVPGQ
ncbi:MAG TPA: HEAT repeat domain-containing protein [Luteolibacter sp.]|nr:HEAT repeat domain-containing protein [Luteolibacter sp.]